MPVFCKLYIHVFFNNLHVSKCYVYKSLLFFYCISGFKPLVCIKKVKIKGRGLKKKKITNLFLLLTGSSLFNFLFYLIVQQIPMIKFFTFFPLKSKVLSFMLKNSISDDDFLMQALAIKEDFQFQVTLFSSSTQNLAQFRSLLLGFKIPTLI
jgi:hypothetical protein